VQTTLVPHTNVCTYVCGHTRVFSVDASDPGAPPSSPTALPAVPPPVVVVALVVVPLLIIRMMGRHTLELKLRDVSSADELRASTTPQPPSVVPRRVAATVRARGGFISVFRSSKETEKIRRWIIPPRIGTLGEIPCRVSNASRPAGFAATWQRETEKKEKRISKVHRVASLD